MSKVSDEVYEKAKKGEIKGFSIDAILELNEVKFKNDKQMSEEKKTLTQSITNAIKEGFNTLLNKQEEVQATPEKVEEVAEPKELRSKQVSTLRIS